MRSIALYIIISVACGIVEIFPGHLAYGSEDLKKESITIALIPEKNESDQLRRYRHISNYLSKKLGMHIRLDLVPYDRLLETFTSGRAQAGFFGSFGYVLCRKKYGIIPLARPLWENNTSTYSGYLITRKDRGIKNINDMGAKKLILVSKNTTAGYIFPKAHFRTKGLGNIESYFSKIVYAGEHENAAWAVYFGEADVGAVKNHIYNNLINTEPEFAEQMMVVTESERVPSNSFAVSPTMKISLRNRIKELLLRMHQDVEGEKRLKLFGAKKFIVTADDHFKPCYEMVKSAGINLDDL